MQLEIVTPTGVFGTFEAVTRIGIETPEGAWGILPRRLDCVVPLAPGIVEYVARDGERRFVAVDVGTLVKAGDRVSMAVRRAAGDVPLEALRRTVRDEFLALDETEARFRQALALVESHFFRRIRELARHDAR